MSRTALFVIDIQRALADDPATQIPHTARLVSANTSILHSARSHIAHALSRGETPDLEIVFVQHEQTPDKGSLQRGSRAWELVFAPLDPPHANEYLVAKDVRESPCPSLLCCKSVTKPPGDTFASNPTLAADLKARGVGTVVACGIQSECCVLSTSRGAMAAGFKVVLLSGAHSTYDLGAKTAAEVEGDVERALGEEGARVVGWEEWVAGL